MDTKKALKLGARVALFPVAGLAWSSMKRSGSLMREELGRTAENTKMLKEVAIEARDRVREAFVTNRAEPETSYAAAISGRPAGSPSEAGIYFWFLSRKRAWIASMVVFLALGISAISHGHLGGLLPLLVGGGICAELAWLAEFRLWQLRGQRLSTKEGGGLSDFWADGKAWRNAFNPESRFGLTTTERRYRRTLWLKRLGLTVGALGILATMDLYFSSSSVLWTKAVAVAAGGSICVLLSEIRLLELRRSLGRRAPVLGLFRFEIGACHESLKA